MIGIKRERWAADKDAKGKLFEIVHNPVFIEAVDLVLLDLVTSTESSPMKGAYLEGVADAFRALENLTADSRESKLLPKPFSHITSERSSF